MSLQEPRPTNQSDSREDQGRGELNGSPGLFDMSVAGFVSCTRTSS